MKKVIEACVSTPKDNRDYLLFKNKIALYFFNMDNAPLNVFHEWSNLMKAADKFGTAATDIVIKKDSLIGNYLMSLFGQQIMDMENFIDYSKVVSAMNIAIFEGNPISEKLIVLFKNQVSGEAVDLERKYGVEVVKYIKENSDFDFYIGNVSGNYCPKEYLVYENGVLSKKTIVEVQKQKSCR